MADERTEKQKVQKNKKYRRVRKNTYIKSKFVLYYFLLKKEKLCNR